MNWQFGYTATDIDPYTPRSDDMPAIPERDAKFDGYDWSNLDFDRLVTVVTVTDAAPQHWGQGFWLADVVDPTGAVKSGIFVDGIVPACGTAGCLAGTAVLLEGAKPQWDDTGWLVGIERTAAFVTAPDGGTRAVATYAHDLLGLPEDYGSETETGGLFSASNTRADIQRICERIAAQVGKAWPVPLPEWAK
jgi:hypothetical protein